MGDTADSPRGGWVNVIVAALLMVATFPGRSHGLGLLTEPILRDFPIDRVQFGQISLWASLLGALFCLPCGWLIDRLGTRPVMAAVLIALGASVVGMGSTRSVAVLAALILLTRGFGQSALSVVSLGVVGKTALRYRELAMGAFAVLMGVGFAVVVGLFQWAERDRGMDWRAIWTSVGVVLLAGVLPLSLVFLTEPSRRNANPAIEIAVADGFTLAAALRTSAFWAVALACSLFMLVSSGTALYYEDILRTFGFDRTDYQNMLTVSFFLGTGFNLVCGWFAQRHSMNRLLGIGSLVLAGSLAILPFARTMLQLCVYAAAGAFTGGAVTVVFFAVWRHMFGVTHLGQIQGVAQMLTVVASAVSQWLFPFAKERFGSYVPLLQILAIAAVLAGVWVWFAPPPRRLPGRYTAP